MQRLFTKATIEKEHKLHGFSPLTTRLLVNRDILSIEDAERFLAPSYDEHMHDPFLLHDMEKAVLRFFEAIESKEKIVIYADYDCDGIPGAVIMHDLLRKIGYENFRIYIPDRHEEGYGLNHVAVEEFISDGAQLLFTIDLGTTDHDDVAYAQANGIDVIVTDHHLPHEALPHAYAIINPKIGESYPEKMLCGSGVVFKFVQAFLQKYGEYFHVKKGWEKWMLDMAGLATLSDMVPLTGENRVIAYFGMHVLRKSPRPGLTQLLRKIKVDQRHLTSEDVTFMITPRINAASRMDSPMRAYELLAERDPVKAGALAEHLSSVNDERKRIVASIMKEVKAKLSDRDLGPVIVIGNPNWRIGVLGIVAGKIMDEYDRPVFVWGREGSSDEDVVKGSCRSNGSINVVVLMESLKDSFVDFGGHELAGGFSVSQKNIHFLEEKLCESFSEHKQESIDKNTIIDEELALSDISEITYSHLEKMMPFGLGNTKPVFIFSQVGIVGARQFGKEKNHLEIVVSDTKNIERTAIAFFADENSFSKKVVQGAVVDLIAEMEKSYFMNRPQLRLRIVDIV